MNHCTLKIQVIESTMFAHRNIFKYTRTSLDGKKHNQIHHKMIDKKWQSITLDLRNFSVADCDTDYYMLIEMFGKILQ